MHLYDETAPKKATNLSVNSDLLRAARDAGFNLSGLLEEKLVEMLRERRAREWREENRAAIEAYNRHVEAAGTFGDERHRF